MQPITAVLFERVKMQMCKSLLLFMQLNFHKFTMMLKDFLNCTYKENSCRYLAGFMKNLISDVFLLQENPQIEVHFHCMVEIQGYQAVK